MSRRSPTDLDDPASDEESDVADGDAAEPAEEIEPEPVPPPEEPPEPEEVDEEPSVPSEGSELSAAELLAGLATAPREEPDDEPHPRYTHEHDDLRLVFRLPHSGDLLAAEACSDVSEARRLLSERCVLEAYRGGEPVPLGQLRDGDIEQLAASMARVDPAVEVRIALSCPACGQGWKQLFDVTTFLELRGRQRAHRLLEEVHQLARSYGWSEHRILAMSDARRRRYLELLGLEGGGYV